MDISSNDEGRIPRALAVGVSKEASEIYKEKNIDFVDAYTVSYMKAKGFKTLCSFDKKHMRRIDWIELVEP